MKNSKLKIKKMNPHPRPPYGGVGMRAVLAFCTLIFAFTLSSCAPKKEEVLEIVVVERGNLLASIPSTGTVMPRNRLEIKPPVAGRIDTILVQEGQQIKAGQILAWMSSLERATLLDAARAQGEEEVKRWEELYKPTPIMAPINGFIIQRRVEPGQSFGVNDIVLVMADYLIVKAQMDETDIGSIKRGQRVEIILDAYPKNKIQGKVEHIAYESKVVSNVTVYEVDIIPDRVPSFFRSGMSATVNFLQEEREKVLMVPAKAVKKRGKLSYVFRLNQDTGKPEPTRLETGLETSENIEVLSGLSEGNRLAIPTAQMLKDFSAPRGGLFQISPFRRQPAR